MVGKGFRVEKGIVPTRGSDGKKAGMVNRAVSLYFSGVLHFTFRARGGCSYGRIGSDRFASVGLKSQEHERKRNT